MNPWTERALYDPHATMNERAKILSVTWARRINIIIYGMCGAAAMAAGWFIS